jgi:TusA-related sulfurtransferase
MEGDDISLLDQIVEGAEVAFVAAVGTISRLKPGTILINACRGPVVDNAALLKRLEAGQSLSVQQRSVIHHRPAAGVDQNRSGLQAANQRLIRQMQGNACRGPVVDNAALLKRLEAGQSLSVVLDVWEPEPALR